MRKSYLAYILLSTMILVHTMIVAQSTTIEDFCFRTKTIMQNIDTIKSKKILYSINDQYFLVLFDTTPRMEYFAILDSLGTIVYSKITNYEEYRIVKARENRQLRKILKRAGNIFLLSNYHALLSYNYERIITSIGKTSYFAVIDTDGKIYADYRLSVLTNPLPINKYLLMYLIRRLTDEIRNYYSERGIPISFYKCSLPQFWTPYIMDNEQNTGYSRIVIV